MAGRVDALIIGCAADPGLEETRAAVGIPVIGAGSVAAAAALAYRGRVGVLGFHADRSRIDATPPARAGKAPGQYTLIPQQDRGSGMVRFRGGAARSQNSTGRYPVPWSAWGGSRR
ncbi:aspartate/glutamate racemase family protein [Arthrobacter crusticola]|uniref:aspartate/glutamate racemase family protein n=1 Tax=Arthrobacter crusticola TaxID=2547960 RepID=UPI001C884D8E|nr:aspartate/glutamate racemase family protein [Arthrobacter crusticola]